MTPIRIFSLLTLMVVLSGCAVSNVGDTVDTIKGDYFLTNKRYEQGRQSFAAAVEETPDSASAHYYYGRFLLLDSNYPLALQHLTRAAELNADKPDYQFWAGVAYGTLKDWKNEEASYLRALAQDEKHLQALIYLGHVELRKKRYGEALALYERALKIWPASPASLYNRALIFNKLGRTPEEHRGWLSYLSLYPSGARARQATEYLNLLDDFSFRNHRVGVRTVTTRKIRFQPFSSELDPSSHASLNLVGGTYANLEGRKLQIVVYQKNNKELAREKALSIRRYLLDKWPRVDPDMIGVSWFSEPHTLVVREKELTIDESVSFFVTSS